MLLACVWQVSYKKYAGGRLRERVGIRFFSVDGSQCVCVWQPTLSVLLSITQSYCLPVCGRLAIKGTPASVSESAPASVFSVDGSQCSCLASRSFVVDLAVSFNRRGEMT